MKKGLIIAIASRKGGVAKTTSVAALGVCYANFGLKTIIIDLDSQANLTKSFLLNAPKYTVANIFAGKSLPLYSIGRNLSLAPADENLIAVEANLKWASQRNILLDSLKSIRPYYDIVLLDSPPDLDWMMVIALTACDFLFVPVEADMKSIDALSLMEEACSQAATPTTIDGIFFTKYESRLIVTKQALAIVKEKYGDLIMNTKIRRSTKIPQSSIYRKNIVDYAPHSIAAIDYCSLAQEISEIIGLPMKSGTTSEL